jgi:hypothetical protein
MRKINGQPVEAITDISDATDGTSGGEALKWDASTGKMVWELQDGTSYNPIVWYGGRGVFSGALGNGNSFTNSADIDYITIASTGNAADFGDLSEVKEGVMCGSDSHGGLQG